MLKVSSALFFKYNTALGTPYRVLVDTNFINFSIQNKLDFVKEMMDCLYAKCILSITECVMAELEKLGQKYRVALRISKEPRFERILCTHEGTYADDCLVERVAQFLPKKYSDENGDPGGAFNVLDAMLKNSLERLKTMRATVTWEDIGTRKVLLVTECSRHVAIIRNLCLGGKLEAALYVRNNMMKKGVVPDVFTHNFLVNGFCKSGGMERANRLFQEMMKTGPSPNCATYNTLITGYCLINKLNEAIRILDSMTDKSVRRNRVTCNIFVHAFCKKGLVEEARTVPAQLLPDDEKDSTDLITSTILVDGCFKEGDNFQALTLWDDLFQKCNQIDVVAYNVLINGFSLNRHMNLAYGCLSAMLRRGVVPDIFTFNSLISCLCREGKLDKACYLLSVTSRMGVDPDHISYKMIIQGLCMRGDMPNANKYFRLMLENNIVPELIVWNVIIHGHGRSGDLLSALSVRDEMLRFDIQPNIFTYNALIYATVKGGELKEALNLKEKMHQNGVIPDVVTYNLLIAAACRIGVIHVAVKLLNEMSRPDVITYTELIRYYCRKGSRMVVEKLIREMRTSGLNPDHALEKIVKRSALVKKLKGLLDSFQSG